MEKLGEGGEAEVFAIDDRRVLRRFRTDHPSIPYRMALTAEVAAGAGHLDVAVPQILDHGVDDEGRPWFEEVRLPGRSMTEALGEVSGARRRRLLDSYLSTAARLRTIRFERAWFGELISEHPIRTGSWAEYLLTALDRQTGGAIEDAPRDIDGLDERIDLVRDAVASMPTPAPSIVHFDYFPGNVMCDDSRITAVIDWSVLSIVGDPDLDVALAVAYLGVVDSTGPEDVSFAWSWLAELEVAEKAALYEQWGALWWLPITDDESIRPWVRSVLGRQLGRGPEP